MDRQQEQKTDERFLSMASMIAAKHGGTIEVDAETRTVNFNVPAENEVVCAMELSEIFKGNEC